MSLAKLRKRTNERMELKDLSIRKRQRRKSSIYLSIYLSISLFLSHFPSVMFLREFSQIKYLGLHRSTGNDVIISLSGGELVKDWSAP